MQQTWLTPIASFLVAAGGIGTLLGVIVQRQNARMSATATTVSQAIDGLKAMTERQDAVIARQDAELAAKDAYIARLEAAAKKRRNT